MLATPLRLGGEWEVGLIDVSYPHNWNNIHRDFIVGLLVRATAGPPSSGNGASRNNLPDDDDDEQMLSDAPMIGVTAQTSQSTDKEELPLPRVVRPSVRPRTPSPPRPPVLDNSGKHARDHPNRDQFDERVYWYKQTNRLPHFIYRRIIVAKGGYETPNELCDYLNTQLQRALEHDFSGGNLPKVEVVYDKQRRHVLLSSLDRHIHVLAEPNYSILHQLGFAAAMREVETQRGKLDVLEVRRDLVYADRAPILNTMSNIYIYSDLVDDSLVGDSRSRILGYLPIRSSYGEQGYWSFNPPYYVRVRGKHINSIKMLLCTDQGEIFPIKDGKVVCRLHFRRVPLLR